MAKMVTLTIDGQSVTVPEGTLIVNAAKEIGIDIPVFCYHPKMEPVGMCRMCLVEIGRPAVDRATNQPILEADGSPRIQFGPKLDTACTTPVSEGMVVRGMTEKVQDARREMLEFLLTSHPLDCPICDKGGECPLQNLTLRFGPGRSRFLLDEKQHLAKHLPLGELIWLDRERCIQCARCVRFQHDIVDDPVLNFYHRGRRFEIQTFSEPGFDSYFSGNTTDICPVGALTTADFRFEARPWEMNAAASICSQCPVGCNIVYNTRREARADGHEVIKRAMPRQNEQVNELWMCDKGRFAYHYNGSNQRLMTPLVRKNGQLVEATWEEALKLAAGKLRAAGGSLVTLAGGRLANEDLFTLRGLTHAQGGKTVLHSFMGGGRQVTKYGVGKGTNFSGMGKGSAILVVGCDLEEEAPIYFLRVKQAADRGADLIVVNPRFTKLEKYAKHAIRYNYGEEAAALSAFLPGQNYANDELKAAAEALANAQTAVVIYGSEGMGLEGTTALADAAAKLLVQTNHASGPNNGLLAVWQHANDMGAVELDFEPDANLAADLRGAGAVYVAAADPAGDSPALAEALDAAGFVVVQELFLTKTAELADVVLPASAYVEREGTFTSGERRVQRFYPALPIRTGTLPDYEITAMIGEAMGLKLECRSAAAIFRKIAAEVPAFAGLDYSAISRTEEQRPLVGRQDMYYGGTLYNNNQGLGVQLPVVDENGQGQQPESAPAGKLVAPDGSLLVVPHTRLYDRGITTVSSVMLHQRIVGPWLRVSSQTAAQFGLEEGKQTSLTINGITAPASVVIDETIPAGVALLPRSVGLPVWEPVAVTVQTPVNG